MGKTLDKISLFREAAKVQAVKLAQQVLHQMQIKLNKLFVADIELSPQFIVSIVLTEDFLYLYTDLSIFNNSLEDNLLIISRIVCVKAQVHNQKMLLLVGHIFMF